MERERGRDGVRWIPRALIELIRVTLLSLLPALLSLSLSLSARPSFLFSCLSFLPCHPESAFVTHSMMIQPVADRLTRRFFCDELSRVYIWSRFVRCAAWWMIRRRWTMRSSGRVEVACAFRVEDQPGGGCFRRIWFDSLTVRNYHLLCWSIALESESRESTYFD